MSIIDRRTIQIHARPEEVFDYIENLPMKFPTLKILETRPFMFLRISLVDGIREGFKAAFNKHYHYGVLQWESGLSRLGASFGPFTLTGIERPKKYVFTIDSFFFKGKTGYFFSPSGGDTILQFDTISGNLSKKEILWWRLIRPIHAILAGLVLRNIRKGIESERKK